MRILFSILVAFGLWSCSSSEQTNFHADEQVILDAVNLDVDSNFQTLAKKIDLFFKKKQKRRLFNGTVLFAENGKVIHKGAYGYANYRKKSKLNVNSVFQLASVSKPFTAYAILYLYEQGELALNDTVQKFIPEFPYPGITLNTC